MEKELSQPGPSGGAQPKLLDATSQQKSAP
jgi:hypothetical protein